MSSAFILQHKEDKKDLILIHSSFKKVREMCHRIRILYSRIIECDVRDISYFIKKIYSPRIDIQYNNRGSNVEKVKLTKEETLDKTIIKKYYDSWKCQNNITSYGFLVKLGTTSKNIKVRIYNHSFLVNESASSPGFTVIEED